jgi:hypothetical protein
LSIALLISDERLILHRLEEQARQKRIDEVEEESQRIIAEEEKRIKTLEQEAAA